MLGVGKIYCIRCLTTGLVYIGSTTQSLKRRLKEHRNDYKRWKKDGKRYRLLAKCIENGNYIMELIEPYPCTNANANELRKRESFWIRNYKNVNKQHYKNRWFDEDFERKRQKRFYNVNKYTHAKIYYIHCMVTGKIYIGSTTISLNDRISAHMSSYKQYLTGKRKAHTRSYDCIIRNLYRICLIEKYPCRSKKELHMRERYWIEQIKCVNKSIPGRTKKEYDKCYRTKYGDKLREHDRKRDKIKTTCICGLKLRKRGLKKHMKSSTHKKRMEYKNAIENNLETDLIECEDCGVICKKDQFSSHIKTKGHLKHINNT